jgi:hypothetical protein
MATAIDARGSVDLNLFDVTFSGFDVAVEATDSEGLTLQGVNVQGRVAVKGSRLRRFVAEDVSHNFLPIPTALSRAIRRAIHGDV